MDSKKPYENRAVNMPFSQETKARMFTRCSRFCCLCLKQCGTNIEAAHIIDEAAGGSNAEENGIPLCFDCHQEIGGYDDRHPKGNRFRPEELRDRRDRVYDHVESGSIYRVVANNFPTKAGDVDLTGTVTAGAGLQGPGGDVKIKGGAGRNGASGGNVRVGPGQFTAGDGGPGGKGGDIIVKGGDAE